MALWFLFLYLLRVWKILCSFTLSVHVCVCVSGEGLGVEEPAAVTIANAHQAAVFADNVQYQFRTESNSGQVRQQLLTPSIQRMSFFHGLRRGQVKPSNSKTHLMPPGRSFKF